MEADRHFPTLPILASALLILLSLLLMPLSAQPRSDQEWQTATLASDILTITCSSFVLPNDVGRLLAEVDSINLRSGEMSQSMSAPFPIKVLVQPQAGSTVDILSTISGCVVDGTEIYLKTSNIGDIITIDANGNINPPGSSVTLDDPEDLLHVVLRGSTYYIMSGPGGTGGGITKVITDAVDSSSAFQAGDTVSYCRIWGQSGNAYLECTCNGSPCPPNIGIPSGTVLTFTDLATDSPMLTLNPASTSNRSAMWAIGAGYEILQSAEVVLRPFGDCAVAEETIVSSGYIEDWITCADSTGDGVAFTYKLTGKTGLAVTAKITLLAVNKNASPTGTFTLACAIQSVRPGTDAYTAHTTTGQQSVSFTGFDTQYRPEQASATITLNGVVTAGAHIQGKCNVSAAPAQIADIRLHGTAVIELSANSFSD